ncbi:MAG: murein L,D-transpeptidase [Gammaproteobacteria bacterium]
MLWLACWLTSSWPLAAASASTTTAVAETLRERVEAIEAGAELSVEGQRLQAQRSLAKLYALNGYQPYWDATRLQSLIEVLEDVEDDGLRPADYHLEILQRLFVRRQKTALDQARLDLLASDAFALVLYHLYFGKVDPVSLDGNWNFDARPIRETDAVRFVHEAIRGNRIRGSAALARPDHWMYAAGREALAQHHAIAALGGWPVIREGPVLRAGMSDPRVALLRRRLEISGDLSAVGATTWSGPPYFFDPQLAQALAHAQRRHRLSVDGLLGSATLRALNVPVERRIAQLRVNLERGRQVLQEIRDADLVVVDVAGFEVHYIRARKRIWQARAVIGQPYRKTPIFKSSIDNIVLNPTWTVPPGILDKDILPLLRKGDHSVLERKNLQVLDRSGKVLDPASIDFSAFTARSFPFTLRQDSGPTNALGVVKINFPNPHLAYLHDTPSKSLFNETERAFSSGCIRTERPLELAELLLADPVHWNRAALDAAVASGETRTVRVPRPVPVLIIYWTADRDDDGSIVFKPDPYGRDARELAALDRPFRPGKRPQL